MTRTSPRGRTVLRSAHVVQPNSCTAADIEILDGYINSVAPHGTLDDAHDIGDTTIAPGLIDIQLNGAYGSDFSIHPEDIWAVAERLPETGVTAFVPTLVTGPEAVTDEALATLKSRPHGFTGAEPLGLHLEGPALSPARKGAHNPDLLQPHPYMAGVTDPATLIVTVAPEIVGTAIIERAADSGTVVSIGHTDATFEETQTAIDAGARHITHLFNAMRPLTHRDPGPIAAALLDDRVTISVIADGHHVHPGALQLIAQTIGPNRLVAITDANAAMGMPPGNYDVGTLPAVSDGNTIRLLDGTLAGSILTMNRAVQYLATEVGLGMTAAVAAASMNPARTIGGETRGTIEPGARADLCILTDDYDIQATLVAGDLAFGELP